MTITKFLERILDLVGKNPVAWILVVLLVVAEYGNHKIGHDLDRVCQLLGERNGMFQPPRTARQEIDNICIKRELGDSENDR